MTGPRSQSSTDGFRYQYPKFEALYRDLTAKGDTNSVNVITELLNDPAGAKVSDHYFGCSLPLPDSQQLWATSDDFQ